MNQGWTVECLVTIQICIQVISQTWFSNHNMNILILVWVKVYSALLPQSLELCEGFVPLRAIFICVCRGRVHQHLHQQMFPLTFNRFGFPLGTYSHVNKIFISTQHFGSLRCQSHLPTIKMMCRIAYLFCFIIIIIDVFLIDCVQF